MLTKDQILGAPDLKTEDVAVPEWGGDVRVRELGGVERAQLFDGYDAAGGAMAYTMLRARLIALSVVDEAGARVFDLGDAPAIAAKSEDALARLWNVASRLSGIGAKAVDTAEGNSAADPNGASS